RSARLWSMGSGLGHGCGNAEPSTFVVSGITPWSASQPVAKGDGPTDSLRVGDDLDAVIQLCRLRRGQLRRRETPGRSGTGTLRPGLSGHDAAHDRVLGSDQ